MSQFKRFAFRCVCDARYNEARSKVKILPDPALSEYKLFAEAPANLAVRMKDGRSFSGERKYPIGTLEEPLTENQVKVLYSKFTQGVLSQKQAEKTAEALLHLEDLSDVQELMDILTFRHRV